MTPKRYYRVNHNIQAREVRVVDETGGQLGVMPLNEALFMANQKGIDLVEVAETAKPPVCKLIDFKKFLYQESKKASAGRKKGKGSMDQKEIRLTPFMGDKDYQDRIRKAKEFLADGHRVKLVVKFFGRQLTRKEFGYKQLEKAILGLAEIAKVEAEPKFQGKLLFMTLKPLGTSKTKENEDKT
jgi:translation initiation factor IF-3